MSLALASPAAPQPKPHIYTPSLGEVELARIAMSIAIDNLAPEHSLMVQVVKILFHECGMSLRASMSSFRKACSVIP